MVPLVALLVLLESLPSMSNRGASSWVHNVSTCSGEVIED